MKFRTFIIPLAVAAGLVLVLGVGLLGGFALRNPLYLIERGGKAVPDAFQFVPKQSPVVASVLARPERLAQLWEYLAAPKLRQGIRADIDQLERALLAETGLSYGRDIQPWLGEEITLAVVSPDLDQDPDNGVMPGYLVVLACQDSETARNTLELFWQNRALAGETLTFEEMAGNRLIYARRAETRDHRRLTSSPRGQLATVLVANRFILVANHPEVLRQAITAAQAVDGNLRSDQRYRATLKTLPVNRVGLLALNLPGAAHWLQSPGGERQASLTLPSGEEPDNQVDWGLISLALNPQGLVADAAWVVAQGHALQPHRQALTNWYNLAQFLPESLAFAALGTDLTTLTQALNPFLQLVGSESRLLTTLLPDLDGVWGPGATDLLLQGVAQPYALGLFQGQLPATGNWLLVSQSSLPLEQSLTSLSDLARQQGLGVGRLEILGFPTTVWTRLGLQPTALGPDLTQSLQIKTDVAGLQAEVDQYRVLTTAPDTMAQILGADRSRRVPPTWTAQLERLPQPSEGYLHLDWPTLQAALREQVPQFRLWETAARPVLRHLQQITLASHGQTEHMQSTSLFLQLANQ